jgi:hypothetical protein
MTTRIRRHANRLRRTCIATFALVLALLAAMPAAAFTPYNGHWWNPAESGRGYNIDVRDGVLVLTVYAYKANGDAEWYLASGPLSTDLHQFSGTLDKYRNGQCISCAYAGRPTLAGNDGPVLLVFQSETAATLTLPGGRVTHIEPFFPPADAGAKLDGTYRLARTSIDYLGGPLVDTASGNFTASGTMVIAGNQVTQTLTIAVAGGTSTTLSMTGTFTDNGAYAVVAQNGVSNRITLVARAPTLVTALLSVIGGVQPFTEVDQWTRVPAAAAAVQVKDAPGPAVAPAPVGGAAAAGLAGLQPRR